MELFHIFTIDEIDRISVDYSGMIALTLDLEIVGNEINWTTGILVVGRPERSVTESTPTSSAAAAATATLVATTTATLIRTASSSSLTVVTTSLVPTVITATVAILLLMASATLPLAALVTTLIATATLTMHHLLLMAHGLLLLLPGLLLLATIAGGEATLVVTATHLWLLLGTALPILLTVLIRSGISRLLVVV